MSTNVSGPSEADRARLAELAEKLRDNVIEDAEVAELDTLLAESAAARETFAELAMLNAELRHSHGRLALPKAATPRGMVHWLSHRWQVSLGLAAGLAMVAFLSWHLLRPPPVPLGEVVATISNSSGATLGTAGGLMGVANGAPLRTGAYDLRAGWLEFAYPNGAMVLVEAPANFELRGTTLIWLQKGNLNARVPEEAIGFTVETPSASVEDLGTEFGVSANAKATEVHVFKGKVLVKSAGEPDPLQLTENRASRIDLATRTPAGISCQPQNFLRSLEEPSEGYVSQVRHLQPVAYYRMRTMQDATLLKDSSSRHQDGVVVSGRSSTPWGPGKIGAALRLGGSGTGTYAVVPNFTKATNNQLSICTWVFAESRPRWASIAKNWAKDARKNFGGQFHFGLFQDQGNLEVHLHDTAGQEIWVHDQDPLPLNQWQFVAFTMDGRTLRLYRNGREVGSGPCVGLSIFAPSALAIGVKLDETGRQPERNTPGFWHGKIDELAIFHEVLTPEQIARLFQSTLDLANLF